MFQHNTSQSSPCNQLLCRWRRFQLPKPLCKQFINSLYSSSSSYSSLGIQTNNQIKIQETLLVWNAMEFKCCLACTLLLLLLLLSQPGFSAGRVHGKNTEQEVYEIDYRGPETHTYIPPPNRAGPIIPHRTKTEVRKSERNVRRNLVRKQSKS